MSNQKHVNVLFINTNYWAYGELFIALEAAETLRHTRFKPLFLIPPTHVRLVKASNFPYISLIPKAGNLNRCLMQDIETSYRPTFVVLADYVNYTFCDLFYGITLEDLNIFSGLLGTFDLYEHTNITKGRVDNYGFLAKNMNRVSVDPYHFILQPVPILRSEHLTNNRRYRYSLFHKIVERTPEDKEKSRKILGLQGGEKMVLLTSGSWQDLSSEIHRDGQAFILSEIHQDVRSFMKICQKVLEDILLSLSDDVKIFCVGSRSLFINRSHKNFFQKRNMLLGESSDFRTYANAADLFISLNYISTSMLELVLSGIPVLLLGNSYLKRREDAYWVGPKRGFEPQELKNCSLAYPFRMFPIGWHRFIGTVMKNNAFYALMAQDELFDKESILNQINHILSDPGLTVNGEKRRQYLSDLKKLTTLEETFNRLSYE